MSCDQDERDPLESDRLTTAQAPSLEHSIRFHTSCGMAFWSQQKLPCRTMAKVAWQRGREAQPIECREACKPVEPHDDKKTFRVDFVLCMPTVVRPDACVGDCDFF